MNFWRQYLTPGDLFIDIGANVGIYTIFALDLGAQVIACEPDAYNFRRLIQHLELNSYEAEALNVAVADKPGTLLFTQGLDSLNHVLLDGVSTGIEVNVTTLDALVGDRLVAGVKIDVEGAESMVLAGGHRALTEHRIQAVQFEFGRFCINRPDRILKPAPEMLRDFGYTVCGFEDPGVLAPISGDVQPRPEKRFRDLFAFAPNLTRPVVI